MSLNLSAPLDLSTDANRCAVQTALVAAGCYQTNDQSQVDGAWGKQSIAALATYDQKNGVHRVSASAFAYPADLKAFRQCKLQGYSDQHCYGVGDNGVGEWGANTAQLDTPMVALNRNDLVSRWGSVDAGAHKLVQVTVGRNTITAAVEDRIGTPARIDLNPAASRQLGLIPPFLRPDCTWQWA